MSKKFEFHDHMADIKVVVHTSTLNQVFESATQALTEYMSPGQAIKRIKGRTIQVTGHDIKSLLCNYLDELLYLIDAEHFISSRAEVIVRGNNLKAELYGDDTRKYQLEHIKAATYAEMSIKKTKEGFIAEFVLDV